MEYTYEIDKNFVVIYKNDEYFDEVDIGTLIEMYIDKKYGWEKDKGEHNDE